MRKIITVLIMLIATAFTVSAETVRYNVKYQNEYGNTETTWYDTDTRTEKLNDDEFINTINTLKQSYNFNEIIDEDSDAKDLAIVNKLDRQGYKWAIKAEYDDAVSYVKIHGTWHKLYGFNWDEFSKE